MTFETSLHTLAFCLGAAYLSKWTVQLASNFHFYFLRSTGVSRYLGGQLGNGLNDRTAWAVITGSGSGIGKAVAFELAAHGFNIVLHGSNEINLQKVKKELEATHPNCSVRFLVLDIRVCASLEDAKLTAVFDEAAAKLKDIDIRIVVHNVGTPQARPEIRAEFGTIDEFTYSELRTNVAENALFHLLFNRALYPQLLTSTEKPRLIVHLGGGLAQLFPCFPSYGPAKSFHMSSAAELRLENSMDPARKHIDVLGVNVLQVTETNTIHDPASVLVPPAGKYAKALVRSMGYRGPGCEKVTPYLPHAAMFWAVGMMPGWLRDKFMMTTIDEMMKEAKERHRKAALTKQD